MESPRSYSEEDGNAKAQPFLVTLRVARFLSSIVVAAVMPFETELWAGEAVGILPALGRKEMQGLLGETVRSLSMSGTAKLKQRFMSRFHPHDEELQKIVARRRQQIGPLMVMFRTEDQRKLLSTLAPTDMDPHTIETEAVLWPEQMTWSTVEEAFTDRFEEVPMHQLKMLQQGQKIVPSGMVRVKDVVGLRKKLPKLEDILEGEIERWERHLQMLRNPRSVSDWVHVAKTISRSNNWVRLEKYKNSKNHPNNAHAQQPEQNSSCEPIPWHPQQEHHPQHHHQQHHHHQQREPTPTNTWQHPHPQQHISHHNTWHHPHQHQQRHPTPPNTWQHPQEPNSWQQHPPQRQPTPPNTWYPHPQDSQQSQGTWHPHQQQEQQQPALDRRLVNANVEAIANPAMSQESFHRRAGYSHRDRLANATEPTTTENTTKSVDHQHKQQTREEERHVRNESSSSPPPESLGDSRQEESRSTRKESFDNRRQEEPRPTFVPSSTSCNSETVKRKLIETDKEKNQDNGSSNDNNKNSLGTNKAVAAAAPTNPERERKRRKRSGSVSSESSWEGNPATEGEAKVSPPSTRSSSNQYKVGTIVKKFFDTGWFEGEVTEYDKEEGYYKILYTDGDTEDMTLEEVKAHFKPDQKYDPAGTTTTITQPPKQPSESQAPAAVAGEARKESSEVTTTKEPTPSPPPASSSSENPSTAITTGETTFEF